MQRNYLSKIQLIDFSTGEFPYRQKYDKTFCEKISGHD